MPRSVRPALCSPVLLLLLLAIPTWAQTSIEVSPETTIAIGGEVLGPEEVGEDDLAGTVTFTGVGVALPAGSNVVAFGRTGSGDSLFSTDTSVDLGAVVARPGDVAHVAAGVPSLVFDASAEASPPACRWTPSPKPRTAACWSHST